MGDNQGKLQNKLPNRLVHTLALAHVSVCNKTRFSASTLHRGCEMLPSVFN